MKRGGPRDGSAPSRVARVERRVEVGVAYEEIEQQLLEIRLAHPRGSEQICRKNDGKWKDALNALLVEEGRMKGINGGRRVCSNRCLDEEEELEGKKYQFVDTARFQLANCMHASPHLQCVVSCFIRGGGWGYTCCPI